MKDNGGMNLIKEISLEIERIESQDLVIIHESLENVSKRLSEIKEVLQLLASKTGS